MQVFQSLRHLIDVSCQKLPLLLMLIFSLQAFSQEKEAIIEDLTEAEISDDNPKKVNSLDGVHINAVENYPHLNQNEFTFGFGIGPFNAYHTGYALEGSYTYYFGKKFAWEILNASIVFPVEKDLTVELAEDFSVNPRRIEQTERILASNVKYVYSYGKSIFMEKHIRYYKSSVIVGAGNITTNINSEFSFNIGLDIDFVLSDIYSWKFQFIDYISVTGTQDFFNFAFFKVLISARF